MMTRKAEFEAAKVEAEIEHLKLFRTARRYEVAAYRARTYHANTGSAMFVPGELTRLKRESAAAQAELNRRAGR